MTEVTVWAVYAVHSQFAYRLVSVGWVAHLTGIDLHRYTPHSGGRVNGGLPSMIR